MELPKQIIIGIDENGKLVGIPVVLKRIGNAVGYVNTATGEIAIDHDSTDIQRLEVLIHELMHLAAEVLKEQGILKRQPNHEFVTHGAATMACYLAMSGMINGFDPEDAKKQIMNDENTVS